MQGLRALQSQRGFIPAQARTLSPSVPTCSRSTSGLRAPVSSPNGGASTSGRVNDPSSSSPRRSAGATAPRAAAAEAAPAARSGAGAPPQPMTTVDVPLGDRSYPIYIGQRLLDQGELLRRHIPGKRVLVVTNETIAPLYLEK